MLTLSPSGIYFSHSRLDTKFSGCGKDIATTLAEILAGHTPVQAIPLITVLEVEGRHISLNNRRLYLFKELLRLGRLRCRQWREDYWGRRRRRRRPPRQSAHRQSPALRSLRRRRRWSRCSQSWRPCRLPTR